MAGDHEELSAAVDRILAERRKKDRRRFVKILLSSFGLTAIATVSGWAFGLLQLIGDLLARWIVVRVPRAEYVRVTADRDLNLPKYDSNAPPLMQKDIKVEIDLERSSGLLVYLNGLIRIQATVNGPAPPLNIEMSVEVWNSNSTTEPLLERSIPFQSSGFNHNMDETIPFSLCWLFKPDELYTNRSAGTYRVQLVVKKSDSPGDVRIESGRTLIAQEFL